MAASSCYQGPNHEGVAEGKVSLLPSQGVTQENFARNELFPLDHIEVYTKAPTIQAAVSVPINRWTGEKGIMILPDVIGHTFINTQLIADQFAKNGYFIMIPDLFDGDAIPLERPRWFDLTAWHSGAYHRNGTGHRLKDVDPIVEFCLNAMRTTYGCQKVGAVGYSFGGKYVVRHLQPGKIDAGFIAHPSMIEREELHAIEGPLSIAAADGDVVFNIDERRLCEKVLREVRQPYQINLYSGVGHGFGNRGDQRSPAAIYAKEAAFVQALQWFDEHL